jgi:uncharacterized protein
MCYFHQDIWRFLMIKIVLTILIFTMSCAKNVGEMNGVEQAKITMVEQEFFTTHPTWNGSSQITANVSLDFSVAFEINEGTVAGTISIPAQNAYDIPLEDIRLEDNTLYFTLKPAGMPKLMWAKYSFEDVTTEGQHMGSLRQGGKSFPTTLEKGEPPTINRPQTPQAPFPYTSRDVEYNNPEDGTSFAGTLTIPSGEGPHPVVLLITGSGSQDRDETIFQHKPFWVIADHLTREGVAVLRVDDRGVGGSTGVRDDLTTLTFAGDVSCGLDFLKQQPEIDPQNMGLIGHSEGGIIAPIVASQRDDVAFIVLLAGTGVNGFDVLLRQNEDIYRAAEVSEEQIEKLLLHYRNAMDPTIQTDDEYERAKLLTQVQLEINQTELPEEELEKAIQELITIKNLPWMQTFMTLEPADYLSKVSSPVLALNGTLDLQVAHDQNLQAIETALQKGGNTSYRMVALKELNHMFQKAQTGTIDEYGMIEETFNQEALELMSTWLLEQIDSAEPSPSVE